MRIVVAFPGSSSYRFRGMMGFGMMGVTKLMGPSAQGAEREVRDRYDPDRRVEKVHVDKIVNVLIS